MCLVAKRRHFEKGMGKSSGVREVFGKEMADIYTGLEPNPKKLGILI